MPRLNGSRSTRAPAAWACSAVRSTEPSSTTTTSIPGSTACTCSTTPATLSSSLYAGTIASRRSPASPGTSSGAPVRASVSCSATGSDRRRPLEPDRREELPGAVRVRVLVERALACGTAELFRGGRIGEERAVRIRSARRVLDDEQLASRLEPSLDPHVRVRHDRRARHRELERPRGRRRMDGGVRAARDVEVDMGGGDRAVEDVEGDVAEQARAAGVASKVATAEREVDVGELAARLADHRCHPLAPELVAVAVEEDIDVPLDRQRVEQAGVGGPEDRLDATRTKLLQARDPA